VELLGDIRERWQVNLMLVDVAFAKGEVQRAKELTEDVARAAGRAGDELVRAHAEMLLGWLALLMDPKASDDAVLTISDRTEALAIEAGDLRARVEALQARAFVWLERCRWGDMLASLEDALPLVQGEDPQSQLLKRDVQDGICSALRYGPIPAPEGIARIEEMTPVGATGAAARWLSTPPLLAMQGDIQEARARVAAGIAYVEERGLHNLRGSLSLASAPVEVLAGDLEAAQREYADGIAVLKSTGTTGVLSTLAAERAIVLYRLGRIEEMDEAIRLARATGSPTDIATQAAWRVAASQRAVRYTSCSLSASSGSLACGHRTTRCVVLIDTRRTAGLPSFGVREAAHRPSA
jgi:hypothetical protein